MPMTLGMLTGGGGKLISDPAITYHGFVGSAAGTVSDQTYLAVPIGPPAPDRVIHLCIQTIAGTNATVDNAYFNGWAPLSRQGLFGVFGFPYTVLTAPWPDGETVDIRIITDPRGGTITKRDFLVHSLYGMSRHTAYGITNGSAYGSTTIQAKGGLWCEALGSTNANVSWSGTLPPTPQTYTNVTSPNGQKVTGCGNVFAARSTGTMVPGGTNVMSMRTLLSPKKPQTSTYIPEVGNYNQPYSVAPAVTLVYDNIAIPSPPAADRFVVMGIAIGAAGAARSISSVTIGGVAATLLHATPAGLTMVAFWGATVPNGTVAQIVVVADRAVDNAMIIWSMKGSGANTPAGSNSVYNNTSNATSTMTMNVPENGSIFFGYVGSGSPYGYLTGVGGCVLINLVSPIDSTRWIMFGCLYGAPANAAYTLAWNGQLASTARSIAGISFASVDA